MWYAEERSIRLESVTVWERLAWTLGFSELLDFRHGFGRVGALGGALTVGRYEGTRRCWSARAKRNSIRSGYEQEQKLSSKSTGRTNWILQDVEKDFGRILRLQATLRLDA